MTLVQEKCGEALCLQFSLTDQHNPKKEKLRMNGANCNSKNNFIVKVIVLFSLAIIAFYLLTEHKAHLLAYSSYILFLGFILLHVFMCRRHRNVVIIPNPLGPAVSGHQKGQGTFLLVVRGVVRLILYHKVFSL